MHNEKCNDMTWQSLKSIIPKTIEKSGIAKQVTAQMVLDSATKLLAQRWGEDMSVKISFYAFNNEGTLRAMSNSSAAVQTLKLEMTDFMNSLNYQLGKRVVYKIQVKIKGY